MNAERLLAHFQQISEAPDAVARLRRFILDLAVRGKLVEQDPGEEDQSARGRLSRFAESSPLIPGSWLYVPLASLLDEDTRNGYSRKPDDAKDGFPILRISAVTARADGLVEEDEFKLISGIDEDLASQYTVKKGDLLACRFNGNKAYVGRLSLFTGYSGRQFIYPDKLIRVRISEWLAKPSFIRWISSADLVRKEIEEKCATTVGNWGISAGKLKTCKLPLPPLAEQHRIVAKVDELMALCDQLEASRQQQEQNRERLVSATLQRLNQPAEGPNTARNDVRFALQVLPSLTTTPAQIKQLRQTILNLAVRGKLVEQDPEDEPAEFFLPGVSRKNRAGVELSAEITYCLPPGWAWRAVSAIAETVTDGEHATPKRISEPDVPLVTAKNVREGYMDYSKTDWVSRETALKAWSRCRPQVGDLLMVCVGATTGRLTVLREARDMVLVRSVALIRPSIIADSDFLEHAIRSPVLQSQIWASVKAAAQPCLYINRINSLLIPLPPLAEQHRIVAKMDELMAICDQLEQQLIQADQKRRRLLEALLAEALGARLDAEGESHADAA